MVWRGRGGLERKVGRGGRREGEGRRRSLGRGEEGERRGLRSERE